MQSFATSERGSQMNGVVMREVSKMYNVEECLMMRNYHPDDGVALFAKERFLGELWEQGYQPKITGYDFVDDENGDAESIIVRAEV